MTTRLQNWLKEHSLKLLAIRDTPEAIAGGVAIGIFFSFTPLFGLKTLLSLFFAWLTRSNLIAAVVAVTLHDVAIPFMPVLYRWEYDLGYWLLSQPHEWPESFRHGHLGGHAWRSWTTFLSVGKPWLVGSVIFSTPLALLSFLVTRLLVTRHRRKHPVKDFPEGQPPA
jgi:uncharacterized protein (DUF2062 family)